MSDIKTFILHADGEQTEDTAFGIPLCGNTVIPYWISNPTGISIKHIKVVVQNSVLNAGGCEGSVTLYSMPVKDYDRFMTKPMVEARGTRLDKLTLSSTTPIDDMRCYLNISKDYEGPEINEPVFIVAVLTLRDVVATNVVTWVDFVDNP